METKHKRHIIFLSLVEQVICLLANETQPKTRRHNQLTAVLSKLEAIDKTYQGNLTEEELVKAENFFNELEEKLIGFLKEEYSEKQGI